MHALRAGLAGALLLAGLTIPPAHAGSNEPSAPRRAPRPDAGYSAGPGLQAAHRLLDESWRTVARNAGRDAAQALDDTLERELVDAHGSVSGVKWRFALRVDDVEPILDLDDPPGFRELTAERFVLGLPRTGRWTLGLKGRLKGRAKVTAAGQTIFSWSPSMRFGFRLPSFRASLTGNLAGAGPLEPALAGGGLSVQGGAAGDGVLEDADASVRPNPDGEGFVARVEGVGVKLPGLKATLDAGLRLDLLPSRSLGDLDLGLDLRQNVLGTSQGDVINLHTAFLDARFVLEGRLKVRLERVGRRTMPFRLRFDLPVPSSDELNRVIGALRRLGTPLPTFGGNPTPPPPPGVDQRLAGAATEIEQAILPHLPYGAALAIDDLSAGASAAAKRRPPRRPGGRVRPTKAYSAQENSGLWTGYYLGAEAFRHAATRSPAALERVKLVLTGIERLFTVTEDAVVFKGERRVSRTRGRIWARSALPYGDDPRASPFDYADGPLTERRCYYEDAERWTARVPGRQGRSFGQYADAVAFVQGLDLSSTEEKAVTYAPGGLIWRGYGCGTDKEVSRDEYTGMMFGLAFAHRLVDDEDVRRRTRALIVAALDHLIAYGWEIAVPPGNRGQDYWFNWDKQLALLKIGASVDDKYVARYNALAPAAALAWLPALLANVDPITQYYKYNLGNGTLAPAIFLEGNDAIRPLYDFAFDVLNLGVRHHKNALFTALEILRHRDAAARAEAAAAASGSNPEISRADELRSLLSDWLDRRDLIFGPNNLPREDIARPQFQADLFPGSLRLYRTIDLSEKPRCLAIFPLMPSQRTGGGMHFMWQRHPFGTAHRRDACGRGRKPTSAEILAAVKPENRRREAPGVDFLLPYWIAVYTGTLPAPAG